MPTALIWGASGGIGSQLTSTLIKQGWIVYGAARQTDRVPTGTTDTFTFDASRPETYREIALLLAQDQAQIDLMIYAAGGMLAGKLEDIGQGGWQQVMDANLNGAYLAVQSILHLIPKGGHVMVIGAYPEKITLPKFGAYTSAKTALEPMMTIFAKENRRKLFTLIRPPAVDTAFWQNVPFNIPEKALQPHDVAQKIIEHYHQQTGGMLDL